MSWNLFSNDKKLNYCLDSLKILLNQRKGITTSTPFTHQEVNAAFKAIYTQDNYAGSNAFWNGGTYNIIKSNVKSFILSATNPKFTNMLLKDLCNNFSFHGFIDGSIPKKRKREEQEEKKEVEEEKVEKEEEEEEELSLWKNRALTAKNDLTTMLEVYKIWRTRALAAEDKLTKIQKLIKVN